MQALQLKRSFKENIADVYSLIGNDDGLITYALSKFYELVPEEERDFSLETFEGNEASVDDIINALAYGSMFGGRRFVTVRDMTAKLSVDDCEKLLDYVRQDDKQNVLILVNSPSIAKVLESYSVIVDCNTMDLPSCVSYIQTLLKFYKVEFDNTAASAIANACNRDFARMNSEVDKIILYCGQEIKADRHTVEEIVPSDAETKVYEFISALQERDYDRAMDIIGVMRAKGEKPAGLLALITSSYKNIFALMTNGKDDELYLKTLNLKSGAVYSIRKRIEETKRKVPGYLYKIKNALYYLYALEYEFKSGKISPDNALDSAIVYLMGKTNAV